jgi:HK97 gp10 family phage protein
VSDSIGIKFDGLDRMLAEFRSLPNDMRERVMKGAVATGASVIRKEAIRLAPEWTGDVSKGHPPPGTLKKAIYQTRMVEQCTQTNEVWIVDVRTGKRAQNVKRGKGFVNLDAYYATWVEYGHHVRVPKAQKKAWKAGTALVSGAFSVAPQPFMRPAFDSKKNEAVQAMANYLAQNISAAIQGYQMLKAA